MTILKGNSKGDQAGEDAYPKAVYANPHQPLICPILAIAVKVFSMGFIANVRPEIPLFEGSHQESRFSHCLLETLFRLPENAELGCKKEVSIYS
jgi:hypothetical protein